MPHVDKDAIRRDIAAEVERQIAEAAFPAKARPGTHEALAAGLNPYHAINLLEALKFVPDTGDWHGSLRIACEMALARAGAVDSISPNQTAEQMADAVIRKAHGIRGTL